MVNFEKYQKVFNGVGVSLGDFSKFTKIVRFLKNIEKYISPKITPTTLKKNGFIKNFEICNTFCYKFI
jgi:hypothetical protein